MSFVILTPCYTKSILSSSKNGLDLPTTGAKSMELDVNVEKSTRELDNADLDSSRMDFFWESLPLEILADEILADEGKKIGASNSWEGERKEAIHQQLKNIFLCYIVFYCFCRLLYFPMSSEEFYWEDIKGCLPDTILNGKSLFFMEVYFICRHFLSFHDFVLEPYLRKRSQ